MEITGDGPACTICQCPVSGEESATECPDCHAVFHKDCWEYNGGCGVYGCSQCPPTEKLTSLEIPPSHWGREEKPCPRCSRMIAAAAVRCRWCGATFSTATPQSQGSYHADQYLQSRLPAVRTASIWLLVFSLIPCTAWLAAIIGTIWYASNRQAIRALPPARAAICKIAVGVAWLQTALFVIFFVLWNLLGG